MSGNQVVLANLQGRNTGVGGDGPSLTLKRFLAEDSLEMEEGEQKGMVAF